MQELKVRKLAVRDVFTITGMLSKVKLPERSEDAQAYGLSIIMAALRDVGPDVMAWLADVAQVPAEDFEAMPPVAIMDVVDGIVAQEEARDFFDRLLKRLGLTSSKGDTAGQTRSSNASASADTSKSPGQS